MKHITFYLDFLSPYTWLAFERLPQELQGLSYSVSYQPVLLGALLQHHGQRLSLIHIQMCIRDRLRTASRPRTTSARETVLILPPPACR